MPVLPPLLSLILFEEDLFWLFVPVGMKTLDYEVAKGNLYKRYVIAYPADTNTYVPDLHSCGQDGLKCCLLCTACHMTGVFSKGRKRLKKKKSISFFPVHFT